MCRSGISLALVCVTAATLSACATTPVFHTPDQLSTVALRCGLQPGDLVQEQDLPKMLILMVEKPRLAQYDCVKGWARRNRLNVALIQVNRAQN